MPDTTTSVYDAVFELLFLLFGIGGIGLLGMLVICLCIAIPVWIVDWTFRKIVDLAWHAWNRIVR